MIEQGADDGSRSSREQENGDVDSRYRALIELLPDAAVVHRDGRVQYCNSAALRLLGARSREELERQPVLAFLHPEERPRALEQGARLLAGGDDVVRTESRLLRRDGEVVQVEASIAAVRFESRKALLVIMRDVSEARRAADALRRSEARLQEALAAANDGVWEMNLLSGEAYRSARIATMLGYDPDDFPGSTVEGWLDLLHPDDRERSLQTFMEHLAGETPAHEAEVRMRNRDGEWRWILVRGRVVEHDETGRPVRAVGTQTDVTDRYLLEQQLRQAQKMEAVGQLAGGVAHDFNNLLTAILANLEVAISQLPPGSPVLTELTDVSRAATRATSLTRKLLTLSRAQPLPAEVVPVNALVRDADRLVRRMLGERITIVLRLDPGAGAVRCDPVQLEQVLLNLIINARDAMPGGGTITIRTGRETLNGPAARRLQLQPGEHVRLSVRDEGTGMDAETQARIFEPFFTTKRAGAGTGLGLPQVYGAVTHAGGGVVVESAPGAGSTFSVLLPRMPWKDTEPAPRDDERGADGVTVLLVEDEDAVRSTTRRLLERSGYRVVEARNGREALDLWRVRRDEVNVVLTDVRMPEMDGARLAQALRREQPGIRLLFMSGYARGVTTGGEMLPPDEAFLEKPFSGQTLLARLREVVES